MSLEDRVRMLLARVEARIEDKLRHSTQLVHDVDMEQVRQQSYYMYTHIVHRRKNPVSLDSLCRTLSHSCTLPIVIWHLIRLSCLPPSGAADSIASILTS